MAETIRVAGLRELGQAFAQLSEDMRGKVARATTNAGAQVVKKLAEAKAPVATGKLRKNIIVKRLRKSDTPLTSEHIVTVRRKKHKYANNRSNRSGKFDRAGKEYTSDGDAFYASFLEFGTVNMAARPFLRPALDEGKSAAIDAMKKRLKLRIDKANRGGK